VQAAADPLPGEYLSVFRVRSSQHFPQQTEMSESVLKTPIS